MGIHPIDLQTMYSQINNVAKTAAGQQQGVPLAQAMQEASVVRQNTELASRVHKTADDEAKSGMINDEGHNSSFAEQKNGGKEKNSDDGKNERKELEIREPYLGVHVDISG